MLLGDDDQVSVIQLAGGGAGKGRGRGRGRGSRRVRKLKYTGGLEDDELQRDLMDALGEGNSEGNSDQIDRDYEQMRKEEINAIPSPVMEEKALVKIPPIKPQPANVEREIKRKPLPDEEKALVRRYQSPPQPQPVRNQPPPQQVRNRSPPPLQQVRNPSPPPPQQVRNQTPPPQSIRNQSPPPSQPVRRQSPPPPQPKPQPVSDQYYRPNPKDYQPLRIEEDNEEEERKALKEMQKEQQQQKLPVDVVMSDAEMVRDRLRADKRYRYGWLACNIVETAVYFVATLLSLVFGLLNFGEVYADVRITRADTTSWSTNFKAVPFYLASMYGCGALISLIMFLILLKEQKKIFNRKDDTAEAAKELVETGRVTKKPKSEVVAKAERVRLYRYYWLKWGLTNSFLLFGVLTAMDSGQVLTLVFAMLYVLKTALLFWICDSLSWTFRFYKSDQHAMSVIKRFEAWNRWLPIFTLFSAMIPWLTSLVILLVFTFSTTAMSVFSVVVGMVFIELTLQTFLFNGREGLNWLIARSSFHALLIVACGFLMYGAGTFSS